MTLSRTCRLVLMLTVLIAPKVMAQNPATGGTPAPLRLAAIPFALETRNAPESLRVEGETTLSFAAAKGTNLFNNPNGLSAVQSAPMVLFEPDGDFVLTAKVTADLKAVYDVAALVVYQDPDLWAKLCYENSPTKEATVVSVVTRELSDDCNSMAVADSFAYLAIARKGREFSFHYSPDGRSWRLIRHFNLALTGKPRVGFAVHGSMGQGTRGVFSEITFSRTPPEKMRQLNPLTP